MNNKNQLIIEFLKKWFKNNVDSKYLPYVNNLFITSILPFVEKKEKGSLSKFKYIFNWRANPRYIMGEGESIHRFFGYDRNYCINAVEIKSNRNKRAKFKNHKLRLGLLPLIQELFIEISAFIFVNAYFLLILCVLIKNLSNKKRYSHTTNKKLKISIARSPSNEKYLNNLKKNFTKKDTNLVILKFFGWTSMIQLLSELVKNKEDNILIFTEFNLLDLLNCYKDYLDFLFKKPKITKLNFLDFKLDLSKSLRHIRIISFNTILYEKLIQKIIVSKNYKLDQFITLELKNPYGYIDRDLCQKHKIKIITIQTCDIETGNIIFPPWESNFFCESKKLYNDLKKLNYKSIQYSGSLRLCQNNNLTYDYEPQKFVFCTSPRSVFLNISFIIKLLKISRENGYQLKILPHPRDFYFLYKFLFYKETIANNKKLNLLSNDYLFITFPSAIILELIFRKRIFMVANFSNDKELTIHDFYSSDYIGFEEKYGSIFAQINSLSTKKFKSLIISYSKYINFLEENGIIPNRFLKEI